MICINILAEGCFGDACGHLEQEPGSKALLICFVCFPPLGLLGMAFWCWACDVGLGFTPFHRKMYNSLVLFAGVRSQELRSMTGFCIYYLSNFCAAESECALDV